MSEGKRLQALVQLPSRVVRDPGLLGLSIPSWLVCWPLISNLSYGCKMAAAAPDITSAFKEGRWGKSYG